MLHNDQYVYHFTQAEKAAAILREGIQPTDQSYRDNLEHELTEVATAHGVECPVDRTDCVFFYPSPFFSVSPRRFDQPSLRDEQAMLVIDTDAVEGPWYAADFELFSDAIDFQHMSEPDQTMVTESREDALRQYADSLTRIDSFEAQSELWGQFHLPEILTQGPVEPAGITKCVLYDQYFSRLLV